MKDLKPIARDVVQRLHILRRFQEWKAFVDSSIVRAKETNRVQAGDIEKLRGRHDALLKDHAALLQRHDSLAERHDSLAERHDTLQTDHLSMLRSYLQKYAPTEYLLAIRKGNRVALLSLERELAGELANFSASRAELVAWARDPSAKWELAFHQGSFLDQAAGVAWPTGAAGGLRSLVQNCTDDAELPRCFVVSDSGGARDKARWPGGFRPEDATPETRLRRLIIALAVRAPALLTCLHSIEAADAPPSQYPPFGDAPQSRLLPAQSVPARPRQRSVLFVNPAYYNFSHLADALRKRGWDAVSMAIVDPASDYAKHFHGHDWNLFEADANKQIEVFRDRYREATERFDMFHFTGVGTLSFFPYNWDTSPMDLDRVPWDVLDLKRRGAKIAYSITGCHDLITQSGFAAWSPGMCPKCPWRDRPEICSDQRMSAWGWKVTQLADLVCLETDPPLDFRDTPAAFREPLSYAVDPEFWRPELGRTVKPPEQWRELKADGEILVYHSVGNYEMRTRNGINVKGTGAVIAAIDRLKAEGHPVRLLFRKEVPSIDNRWVLAQADIIVDQLNYGRYGATAREGMMLGRPVVGRINKAEAHGLPAVRAIAECPIVDASEETVYDVLKALVTDPAKRARIGAASREHAVRWWSKDVLAERYERVYDHLQVHGRPPTTLD